jgi:hypothetical protein
MFDGAPHKPVRGVVSQQQHINNIHATLDEHP